MTDHLLSAISEGPTALSRNSVHADGNDNYGDVDYHPQKEMDKPVILELGVAQNSSLNGTLLPDYQLDMNMNNAASYFTQQQMYSSGTEHQNLPPMPHISMYSNPYTQHSLPPATTITPISRALHAAGYSTHLPQPVCNWATAADAERKLKSNIVPPPMYISYLGVREHLIGKETNPSWKEKAMQIEKDYKKTACDRERTRMRDMNRAFDLLRSKLPISKPNGKKYSKIESLRIAINYINHLQQILKEPPTDMELIAFSNSQTPHTQTSAVNFVMDMQYKRRAQMFQYDVTKITFKEDTDKDLDDPHSVGGDWNNNTYVPNGHDQWD